MQSLPHRLLAGVLLVVLLVSVSASGRQQRSAPGRDAQAVNRREAAYHANNVGVARMERFDYKAAAESFRRALAFEPNLAIAQFNLSLALLYLPDLDEAARAAQRALELMPDSPRALYLNGIIAKKQNRTADALDALRRALQLDGRDVGINIQLAQIMIQQRSYEEAIVRLREALALEPYNVTATYNLAIALLRTGKAQEGQAVMQQFQTLRESDYGTTLGQNYLEEGDYAEALISTGAEPELVNPATPAVQFVAAPRTRLASRAMNPASRSRTAQARDADGLRALPTATSPASLLGHTFNAGELNEATRRAIAASFAGDLTLFDYDGDGDLDLFEVSATAQRLYRNERGQFIEATRASGLGLKDSTAVGLCAIAGDYDNDKRNDLLVLRFGGLALYHNEGSGRFKEVTQAAGIAAYSQLAVTAAFADLDHDGDLDIFIAGLADLQQFDTTRPTVTFPDDFAVAPNRLLRNNGNGRFTDITNDANLSSVGHAVAIVPTDFNNRRDLDLFILHYGGAPALLSNQRTGTFRNLAAEAGLTMSGRFTCVAAGDVNKDSFTDFFIGGADKNVFVLSDGRGRFTHSEFASEGTRAAQFLDYDNDGLLDLVLLNEEGLQVFRNLGTRWMSVTDRAVTRAVSGATPPSTPSTAASRRRLISPSRLASADLDRDGDTDLLLGSFDTWRLAINQGGNRLVSLRVQLEGRAANRNGIGAKIEMRAGSLSQKLETYAVTPAPAPVDVVFGLGRRARADAVRVLWSSGNVQAELADSATARRNRAPTLNILEVDRKPSSCPYLYTWNGERFVFLTDFLGGGEMGYLHAPDVYNTPDPDEYVRITDDQLKPRDGRLELRITNELEEALFVDRLQLLAIAHPADTEVYPNEGLSAPPRDFKLFVTRAARPPIKATDEQGRDVRAHILKRDRQYADTFQLERVRGYAKEHALTLDLGRASAQRCVLLLTGWTDYAFSSDNLAAHQLGLQMKAPELQVKDEQGNWQTVIANMGFPAGRPQTVTVDLTNRFLSKSNREVRIITTMRIYWDEILVDTTAEPAGVEMVELDALRAELRWRGFSAAVTPDGKEPLLYDYHRVSLASPWKVMAGRYTRPGDVRELLSEVDDLFVVSLPGDEIALSFDATQLAPLRQGWKRTFLLYADGYSKEMDINSASPHDITPFPFRAMRGYPSAGYPLTEKQRAVVERYNTRIVKSALPRLTAEWMQKR